MWRNELNAFVELTKIHRQGNDKQYAKALENFRLNAPTDNDIKLINSRVVKPTDPLPHDALRVSPENNERCLMNRLVFEDYLRAHPVAADSDPPSFRERGAITVVARLGEQKAGRQITGHLRKKIEEQGYSKWHCDPRLDLIVGCPVLNLNNDNVKGIYN